MKKLLPHLCWALVPFVAASALAQTGDGYVGIYQDSLGTQACASVPPSTSSTLYVIAKTAGQSADGITGAEFRIEVTSPSGWMISYNAPSAANIVSGNPIDTDPEPDDGSGVNLGFPECQEPDSSGQIKLGTLSVFNQSGSPTNLLVRRHSHASNAGFACPLFVKCDDPYYTLVCMTASPLDSCTLGTQKASVTIADDPTVFTASLNEGGSDPGQEPSLDGREALTEFVPGTISLPPGETKVSLTSVTINSDAVRTVLEDHNVTMVGKTFPNFTLADTLGYDRFGEPVPHANLSEHYTLTVPVGGSATALAADLTAASREVVFAELNGGNGLDTACQYGPPCSLLVQNCPNDTYFMSDQWPLSNNGQHLFWEPPGTCREDIHANEAWEITTGDSSTIIGVLDTGVNRMHEDLLGKVFGDEGYSSWYCAFHGTAVAGVAAAWGNNGAGLAGVDWNARILAKLLPMQPDSCTGGPGYDAATVSAIRDAAAHGADILNNSWLLTPIGRYSTEVRLAFRDFYMDKRIAVASMGNMGDGTIQYPAAFVQGIIAAGSTDKYGNKSNGSSTGRHIDVVAPGEYLMMCYYDGGYAVLAGGTSFAAPHVSGVAGLLLSANNNLEPDDVEQIISMSADDIVPAGFDTLTGWGRINAERALDLLRPPSVIVQDSVVGGEELASDWSGYMSFEYPPPGVPHRAVRAIRYPVERTVSFPMTFQTAPKVWGRGSSTVGYSTEGSTSGVNHINFGMGWCAPVGPIFTASCRLRTYVYDLFDKYGNHLGWAPTDPGHVVFAYTALWEAKEPTDNGDEATNGLSARLALQGQNPLQADGALQLSLPKKAHARLEIFSVTGRRIAVLHDGILGAGRHAFAWRPHGPDGTPLASGLYFARVEADGQRVTKKLVLIR